MIVWNHPTSAPVFPRSRWKSMLISSECPLHPYRISQFIADSVHPQSVRYRGVQISLVAPKVLCLICIEYIQLCAVAVHKLQFRNKIAIMPANIPPGILEFIVRLSGRGLSQRAISRNGTQECHNVVQYIPRNMHTVFALLCFVVVIHWLIFPYPSGLLHWHCGNLTIAPVPAKQPWWIWINTSYEFIINDCITTTKQSTTKPCAYFLGYTVSPKFSVVFGWLEELSKGHMGIGWWCPRQGKTVPLSESWGETGFAHRR